jgi:hypothetical protein
VQLQPEPKSCRCPRCITAFQQFLRRKYPAKEAAILRFGYPDPDYVQLTEWDVYNRPEDVGVIDDPVLQEWVEFRSRSLAGHNADFYNYIKSSTEGRRRIQPKGSLRLDRMRLNGVYHPFFKALRFHSF